MCVSVLIAATTLGGPLPTPLPLFPADNWWNADISAAPVDPNSSAYISFINNGRCDRPIPTSAATCRRAACRSTASRTSSSTATTAEAVGRLPVRDESDGVNHTTGASFPFYPIPDEAITQPHWVEGGEPGNVDRAIDGDRHLLIVDRDNRHLYELYNVFYDGAQWHAGSGAFFDLNVERAASRRLDVRRCRGARHSARAGALRRSVRRRTRSGTPSA